MSDTEDGSFASADEGEEKNPDTKVKEKLPKMADKSVEKDSEPKQSTKAPTAVKSVPETKPKTKSVETKKTDSSKSSVSAKTTTKKSPPSVGSTASKDKRATPKSPASSSVKSATTTPKNNPTTQTKVPAPDVSPASEKTESTKTVENISPKTESANKDDVSSEPLPEVVESNKNMAGSKPEPEEGAAVLPGENAKLLPTTAITTTPEGQQIPREKKVKTAEDTNNEDKNMPGVWDWGKWGATIVDVASSSVNTFTTQVGEGFHTIIETVETSLAGPLPEDMDEEERRMYEEQNMGEEEPSKGEEQVGENSPEEEGAKGGGWFSGWGMSNLTSVVQSTTSGVTNLTKKVQDKGKTLVTGGLDVLETIGKKTYDVITEHDPGLKRTRQVLFDRGVKPNLSYVLRDAKDQADQAATMEKEAEEARKVHFGAMFDEYQGLAHLEALEILSNQCEKRVQSLLGAMPMESLDSIKQELIQIKQVFELDDESEEAGGAVFFQFKPTNPFRTEDTAASEPVDQLRVDSTVNDELEHEFVKLITDNLLELHLGTTPDKLNKAQEKIRQWITEFYEKQEKKEEVVPKEIHEAAIQALAEMTAKSVEQFHKAGELILLQKDSDKSYLERSKCLASLTRVLCTEMSILSTKFVKCLNKVAEDAETEHSRKINMMVTNVYLEATNSSTYIQDAFQLLLPVLQQGAIENSKVLAQTQSTE